MVGTAPAVGRQPRVRAGARTVAVAGGDGTVSAVAAGRVRTPTPLGIIPLGTANVLARELIASRHDFIIARIPDDLNPRLFEARVIGVVGDVKAGGLDAALKTLADRSYGPWQLGLVALGIACFGVYCFFQSRDRKV